MKNYDVSNMGLKDAIIIPSTSIIIKPPGIYDGNITVQGDSNLIAANILSGKTIFGVVGNVTARQYATGTVTTSSTQLGFRRYDNFTVQQYYLTVSGLTFQPNMIMAFTTANGGGFVIYNAYGNFDNAYAGTHTYLNSAGYSLLTDGASLYINATGFQLPYNSSGVSLTWYAFG